MSFSGHLLVVLLVICLMLGIAPQFLQPALPDTSWLLYAAERLRRGARLYVDVVEVNPPLIVWLNLPVAALAELTGLAPLQVYRCAVAGVIGLSLSLIAVVLGRNALEAPTTTRVLMLLSAVVLAPLAGSDFGEREHLLLVGALPYVFMVAARLQAIPMPGWLALLAGVMAGAGLALKPYFLVLPLVLEGGVLLTRRGTLARAETLAIASVLVLYLAAVQLWAPEYWDVARTFGAAYYRFLQEPWLITAVTGHGAGLVLCALLAYSVLRKRGVDAPLGSTLFLATLALYGSAVLQRKGWRYHFYPAMGTSLLLLGWLTTRVPVAPTSLARRLYRAVALAVTLFLPLSLLAAGAMRLAVPTSAPIVGDPDLPRLVEVVRREADGRGVLVLSTNMASAFPMVPMARARWTSRYPSVWMLGAAYQDRLEADTPLQYRSLEQRLPLERAMMAAVSEDLTRHRPELIVVLRPAPDRWGWGVRRLDYVRYFAADPAFSREFARYGFLEDVGEYRLYRRRGPGTSSVPEPPPDLPPPADVAALAPGLQVAPPGTERTIQAALFLVLLLLVYRYQVSRAPAGESAP